MIVLDEHPVREIKTMILTPAASHGILVDDSQTRGRLASVENAGAGARHGFDELARERGDSAHSL